jgi:hypothetical protein
VFSSGQARRARNGKVIPNVFLESEEADALSVDRLDHASDYVMAEIGDRVARLRGSGRTFYGWATVTVLRASQNKRSVRADPLIDNQYHAEIDLNLDNDRERRDQQREHAVELASMARWRPRPPV